MIDVKVRHVPIGNDHDDSKWIVLEAYVEGMPQLTKRGSIATSALASGAVSVDYEKARLIATVHEYHGLWLAAQEALANL